MPIKITLITPPDIYQNDNSSILLIDPTEKDQDAITEWLGNSELDIHLNIYFYQGETNAPWILHALACSSHKYINLNNMSAISSHLASYILSKSGVYYTVDDTNIAELYSHINTNRVDTAVDFLERILSGKR